MQHRLHRLKIWPAICLFGFAALSALTSWTWRAEMKTARRPNILFILSDDQRFDTIHALGNPEIKTPNLDKLAKRGFVFTNTYCQGGMIPAVCAPSRTMLMTGRSLFHIPQPNAKSYDGPTLGGVFNDAGYTTLHVGKRGNSFLAGNEAFQQVIYCDKGVKEVAGQGEDSPQAQQPKIVADAAIDFLRGHQGDKPFFIYLAPHYPHDPRIAPKQFHALYDPARLPLSPNFMPQHPFDNGELYVRDEKLAPHPRTPEEMKRHLADYYACITHLDYHIGRIMDALREAGHADDTIIVFTSDQGLAVGGRHGLMGKQNLYEHFKSPLIIAGPSVKRGQSDALVYLFDLFPTLCDFAGINAPNECEGASLVPIIKGQKKQVRQYLFAAYRDYQRMVRDQRWKLIWYPQIKRFQLFDLARDPWELNNLANQPDQSAKLAELKKALAAEQKRYGDKIPPAER
ncbi:MAG TPA: sulfatase-like hydrolase/transferase [Acidobacteriota bacterium]|nr:sulfatase-like hydrolase/transferase [Acidobacteriota bacterium]